MLATRLSGSATPPTRHHGRRVVRERSRHLLEKHDRIFLHRVGTMFSTPTSLNRILRPEESVIISDFQTLTKVFGFK